MSKNNFILQAKGITKNFESHTSKGTTANDRIKTLLSALAGNYSKSDRDFTALQDISLSIKQGDCVGIIGLNGAGKSTLLQIIAGTLLPTSGTVQVDGKVAALLELGSGFNPEFTGKENIYLNASVLGLEQIEIDQRYESITRFADIGNFIDSPVRTYSTGMIVRLGFSIVAHVDADLLIVDEALAVGDANFQSKCFRFLESLKDKGKTLLFVSHDLNSVARLCSSTVLLHKGAIHAQGNTADVINEYSRLLVKTDSDQTPSGDFSSEKSKSSPENKQGGTAPEELSPAERKALLAEEHSETPSLAEEFAYGNQKAQISKIKIFNENGEPTTVLQSGEKFSVEFKARAQEKIVEPIYAMIIRDCKGQQIYGQNTYFAKTPTKNLDEGSEIKVSFRQSLNLGSGDYLISLGLTRFEEEELQVIHRRYDALKIKVVNNDGSIGLANCFSSIGFDVESEAIKRS